RLARAVAVAPGEAVTHRRERTHASAERAARLDLDDPDAVPARLARVEGLRRAGVQDGRGAGVLDEPRRVDVAEEPEVDRRGAQLGERDRHVVAPGLVEVGVEEAEDRHVIARGAQREGGERTLAHPRGGERPADDVERAVAGAYCDPLPTPAAAKEVEPLAAELVGEAREDVMVVVAGDGDRR